MLLFSKVIDTKIFLESVGDDTSHLDTLISIFAEQSRDNIAHMYTALGKNDYDAFERAAHDIKNLGRNIAANKLIEHSQVLEELAAKRQLTNVEELIENTKKLLDRAQSELVKIRKKFK